MSKFHDKNFVSDERRRFVGNLRNKYKKNIRLSTMSRPPPVERALSWNENHADACIRRTSDVNLNKRGGGRAYTVDLSPSSEQEATTPVFMLDDTVFEVDEENQEVDPLLSNDTNTGANSDNNKSENKTNGNRRVQFDDVDGVKTNKSPGKEAPQRADTHHAGMLMRQDAMKDSDSNMNADIPLQDVQKKEKLLHQMSV